MASATVLQAKVKSVISGDTLVLAHPADPRKERQLSLAFVSAPRLKKEGDEPFAYQSRDFIRKQFVGKVVNFRVLYTIPQSKRDYGIAWLPGPTPVQIPEAAVREGWLKVREDAGKRDENEEVVLLAEKLQVAEAHAKADGKGVWSDDKKSGDVDCAYELPDAKAFVEENKGKSLDAVVERVLTGDRLIVRLILSPTKHVQTMVLIAGIRAPSTRRTNPSDGKEQPAEPFGDESQAWVEERLLQRQVQVKVLALSPQNQLVGSVIHPQQGSVAPHILKLGLAKCTDFHSTLLGGDMATLRQAEAEAKKAQRGLFRGHVAAQKPGSETDAVVSRVFSADTIFLRNNKTGAERRINLSSVRQPKPSDAKQSPWQAEAKEFLRKRLIGKHVKFHVDGKRAATEGYEEREVATLIRDGKNVGLLLVENGMASVIRHRQDDTDRSPIYDELLQAESAAQEAKKGIWSEKAPATKQYVDYSESLEKAKRQLALLSRQKKVPAVVDFVKSASRFTVLVPRENAKLTFVLSGITAPRSARNPGDKSDPFGQEAHDFASKRLQQRDVEIDVESNDKVGGFIGTLYINRENFTKLLLEEGYASVHAYSAEKSGNANELFAAEKRAKEARKGLWENWDPSQEEGGEESYDAPTNGQSTAGANGDAATAPRKSDYRDVVITHIDENGRLKLQELSRANALDDLQAKFKSFHLSTGKPLDGAPKAGDLVSGKFLGDWYRAKVRRNDREKQKAELYYIDYGNSELVDWKDLRGLPGDKFGTANLKPMAIDASLSYIQYPTAIHYQRDSLNFLREEFAERKLVASVDQIDRDGSWSVTLFDSQELGDRLEDSVNALLVKQGLAMVPRKLKAWERGAPILKSLKKDEDEAKDAHAGCWEYGDITADED
jgi:staphylococcal nuclease domain-containing protein 1